MRRTIVGISAAAVLFGASCGHSATGPATTKAILITLQLNALQAAASITIDGITFGTIGTTNTVTMQVPLTAKTLTYLISNSPISPPQDIQPDMLGTSANVAIIGSTYSINNIINNITYVDPTIINLTGATAYVGIFRNGAVTCLAPLLIGSTTGKDFGYWKLSSDTEFRAYSTVGCTGPYHSYGFAQLSAFTPNSGTVTFNLSSIP